MHHKFDPNRGSNSCPPDDDSTFHVTEMPALTTRPLMTHGRNALPRRLKDQDLR